MKKHSNISEYREKIKNKNINVKVIGQYVNSSTKIEHICYCGKEWFVSPNNVLRGRSCGCRNKSDNLTNKIYLKKLSEASINVKPLEEYKNMRTKILHKCTCGKEWKQRPDVILGGHKCGCERNINSLGFSPKRYKNKKTVFYYIKVNNYYKIGITIFRNSVEYSILNKRFRYDIKQGVNIEILKYKVFDDGEDAYLLEQELLKDNKKFKYKGPKILNGGNTEIITENILGTIIV